MEKWVVPLVLVMLCGCSHQEFNRPTSSLVTDWFDSGEPYLEAGETPRDRRAERLAEVLAAWKASPKSRGNDYLIGPRDVIEVSIYALESSDETTTLKCTVSQEGWITLPWVGRIQAGGFSARQLEERIRTAYAAEYIQDPQVTFSVLDYRSASVIVTGAIAKPDVYYLSANSTSVLSILGRAGGPTKEAGDELHIIRAEPSPHATIAPATKGQSLPADAREVVAEEPRQVTRIDLVQLVDEGNLLFNMELRNGDIVKLPPQKEEYVYVLGFVRSPGAIIVKGGRMGALRAVSRAGGLSPLARAENSRVVRETEDREKPLVVDVDLTKIVRGVRPLLYLKPGDTLVVGSSIIARLSEFIRPAAGASANVATGVP